MMEKNIEKLLSSLGEDTSREGLKDTPKRVVKYYKEFLKKEDIKFTTFDAEGYHEPIIITNIKLYSLCEHHLLPIIGFAHVAYIPTTRIVGLSKIPRVVKYYASNLQNQERLTNDIHSFLQEKLNTESVAVIIDARHMCMEMRGIKTPLSSTRTMKITGNFASGNNLDIFLKSIETKEI